MKAKMCPFCGENPEIMSCESNKWWRVICDAMECEVLPESNDFASKQKAISAWNKRKEEKQ